MANLYSAHALVGLTGSAGATFEAYITAPSTGYLSLESLIFSGDFSSATDDPVLVELLRVTGQTGGTAIVPSKHNTEVSLASGATVHMDSVTAVAVADSTVFSQYVRPSFSFTPGVTVAPGETWAVRMTPGAQTRNMNIGLFWKE